MLGGSFGRGAGADSEFLERLRFRLGSGVQCLAPANPVAILPPSESPPHEDSPQINHERTRFFYVLIQFGRATCCYK
jgi:hypothetical protein